MALKLKKRSYQEFFGSWFKFPDPDGVAESYWSGTALAFTETQWHEKFREMADLGLKTVLLGPPVANGKSFYPSDLGESWKTGCPDLVKTFFESAEELGMEIYLGAGNVDIDLTRAEELGRRYGHHRSFAGWQLVSEEANSTELNSEFAMRLNRSIEKLRGIAEKPVSVSLSARAAAEEEGFADRLQELRADQLVYRDGVGMRANEPADLPEVYGRLAEIHRDADIPLWACVELFAYEGLIGKSALIPAAFSRVKTQIETISMYAEALFCCQYFGLMNPGSSSVFVGHESSATLHYDYGEWRQNQVA